MAVADDALEMLRKKLVLGEYGAFTRPYVVLDVDEYRVVLEALEAKSKSGRPRKVPREAVRA